MLKQVYLKITGRVQGVFFRAHTKKQADQLGITGWVMNSDDGSVEVLAQGEQSVLENFILWCKKGPDSSNVEKVQEDWHAGHFEKLSDFTVKY